MLTASSRPVVRFLTGAATVPLTGTNVLAAVPSSGDAGNYLRMIWGLLIVLAVILLLYGLVKKRFSLFASSARQEIKVVEMKPLMGKKGLCLVEVRGQEYLLGIGGDTVTHIATLSQKNNQTFAQTLAARGADLQP